MKILGLDLGTNSIGLSVRNIDRGNNLKEQLEYFTSVVFKSGVGDGKSGEYSYAAERRGKRSARRLYQARKYRIWATLDLLIKEGYCPLSIEDLDKWRKYDKEKGLKRQYPIHAKNFEQWVRLDFNGDGVADYSSPYQLRAELMQKQFDFSQQTDKYKLGRALYHIAQRRGFKSSKGETLKSQEAESQEAEEIDFSNKEIDITEELKKSEEKISKDLKGYMKENNLKTVGCAFAKLEKDGVRVRNSKFQAVRSQYKDEVIQIFEFQKGLDINSDFYKRLISEKKKEGTIFYKRPLRSQKGLVGKCTLEKNKPRCPISHPEFEKFRAWSFINNVKYRKSIDEDWQNLTLKQRQKLYKEKFLRVTKSFKFKEIREWIEKNISDGIHNYTLVYNRDKEKGTINYNDDTNVSGCPISGRMGNLLGDDWENFEFKIEREHKGKKYNVTYTAEDIWHIAFSFDEAEFVKKFAEERLKFDTAEIDTFIKLHNDIQQGYSMLSLKAIKNINRFLEKGFIYTEAVLLAKLPEIFGKKWEENELKIVSQISSIISENRKEKDIKSMANTLIANYKSLEYNNERNYNEKFAEHNFDYKLQDSDYSDIKAVITNFFGKKTWNNKNDEEKKEVVEQVAKHYQSFFSSEARDYYKLPSLSDSLAKYLLENFDFLDKKELQKIYHPSMISFYKSAKEQQIEDGRCLKLLGSPVIGAIKNPMAMRVLHILRRKINSLLKTKDKDGNQLIDENTRIVVETAREINDANMRWAINAYQRAREAENKIYENAIIDLFGKEKVNDDNIDKVRLLCEQYEISIGEQQKEADTKEKSKKEKKRFVENYIKLKEKDIQKYRLWLEQGCRCIYTGELINIKNLFDDNFSDFEHTIPRSKSFDNSLANQTICDAHYNRSVKKNRIPTELENYDKDAVINGEKYTAILPRLKPWFDKVEQLQKNVEFWKGQSKKAADKDRKDYCIRQRHLWQMDLDYWQNKLSRFTMKEVTAGFRNSQLVDTRIITKYAYHYLKTVFNKVEVQNGDYTSDYRKMLGIQNIDEKKDRSKHSHHAIDATVLTLIPVPAKRDKMLQLFYEIEEEKQFRDVTEKRKELNREIDQCGFGKKANEIVNFIESNILINHVSKDQTLTPANKILRKRGKIVPLKDKNGKIIYETNENGTIKYRTHKNGTPIYKRDENGNFLLKDGEKIKIPIPKSIRLKGDSIRGQLHKDSFFGAIKYPQTDDNNVPIIEDGRYIYETDKNGNEVISMVMRVLITNFKDEKDLDKIIDPKVKSSILKTIEKRKAEGKTFSTSISEPIWLLDKNGNEIKKDKNGRPLLPIRHIRCRVAAGKGFFTKDKAIEVKEQTYKSRKDYKNYYYAQNDGNYLCLLYECYNKGKLEREFKFLNYFEVAKLGLKSSDDIKNEPYFKEFTNNKKQYKLSAIIKAGTRVLIYKEKPEELFDLEKTDLHKRLYNVYKFNFTSSNRIYLQSHIEARANEDIKNVEDFTVFDNTKYQARLNLVASNFNCIIEGRDFEISKNGKINFINLR